jgi:hypothetical protein
MRQYPFLDDIRARFPIHDDHDLAVEIAEALYDASKIGGGQIGSFEYDGVVHFIRTDFVHHCINWDCNPATCYTDWTLTTETPAE